MRARGMSSPGTARPTLRCLDAHSLPMKNASLAFALLAVGAAWSVPLAAAAVVAAPTEAIQGDKDTADAKRAEAKAQEAAAAAAAKTLKAALKQKDPALRRDALTRASAVVHPKVIKAMTAAFKDSDPTVRRTLIELFGTMTHADCLTALRKYDSQVGRKLKKAKEHETRVGLIRAVGRHTDPGSLNWLLRGALDEDEFSLRQARIYGAGRLRTKDALRGLFKEMGRVDPRRVKNRMRELRPALIWISGVDKGNNAENWLAWWRENQKSFVVAPKPPKLTGQMAAEWRRFWGEAPEYERPTKRTDRG